MHIEVTRVPQEMLRLGAPGGEESSALIRSRVMLARDRALARAGRSNARLTPPQIKRDCPLSEEGHRLLETAIDKLGLSHRAYHRILKVARTIADLAPADAIGIPHLSEAIGYRRLDRQPGSPRH
jgi:magnesium chelatase family protein